LNQDFENIEYLKSGNEKQKLAYEVLTSHSIMEKLKSFDPILVGTIPINIDIENSDLDIICYNADLIQFEQTIKAEFQLSAGFTMYTSKHRGVNSVIANFTMDGFTIEIFGQAIPTKQQYGYQHMIVEHKLLTQFGEAFRQKIIELKRQGYKTEPAFGIAMGLDGNAYQGLLNLKM
jgi:hypothetical protein